MFEVLVNNRVVDIKKDIISAFDCASHQRKIIKKSLVEVYGDLVETSRSRTIFGGTLYVQGYRFSPEGAKKYYTSPKHKIQVKIKLWQTLVEYLKEKLSKVN